MPGKRRGEQRLARPRRAAHQQVVAAGRGDLDGALGGLLALDLGHVGAGAGKLGEAACRRRQQLRALQMVEQAQKIGRRHHIDFAGPGRFAAL